MAKVTNEKLEFNNAAGQGDGPASTDDALYRTLVERLGADRLSSDASVRDAHASDWSDAPRVAPAWIVMPRSPQEVAAALDCVRSFGGHVVVQGGMTGLAGGATPREGEIALSLARLDAIEAFDEAGGTVTVQAGVPLATLQQYVEAAGWFFPLDLGARGSCQIGGNAATNAGGNRVVRFGTMREQVLGLEVALPDGTLLSMMNRVQKNTTGIDLKQLFIGAEGTLGIIVRLVLKLVPALERSSTALCAMRDFEQATRLLKRLRAGLPGLSSFELMWQDFTDAAAQLTGARAPFDTRYPLYALIETLNADDDSAVLERVLTRALEDEIVADAVVAQSLEHARQLWQYREAVGELLAALKPHAAFDVGLPMEKMASFVANMRATLAARYPDSTHLFFGHLGDGNLHLLSGPYRDAATLHDVETCVYRAVARAGGCISGEHGIGVLKTPYLPLSRSAGELATMRALKALFDPQRVLNVGRILDA
ncbi:FAD-binding oxidoreductase [Chitinasiproducens palmae]|uniref:FAD-binding oxidoreductase n=1 Tax=Chitinasiproducens palmae TaxID=1770053 RepID=UPI001F4205DC|nr:FAD-binding oxidoreductase [Chitinasiproducens palmae]